MSIKSTKHVTREIAIQRINEVYLYVVKQDYIGLERDSFDPNEFIEDFINQGTDLSIFGLEKWENSMLEDKLDEPFFRWSMFENYRISSG